MEPIGATASLVTLIHTAALLLKKIQNVYGRWRNTAKDVKALSDLLSPIEIRLDDIYGSATTGHPLVIDTASRKGLVKLVEEARDIVKQLKDSLARVGRHGNFGQRAVWAMRESQNMDKMMGRLWVVEDRMFHWLQVLLL